jgi:predicted metalloprotease
MQWRGQRESDNIEDRRGMSGTTKLVGGGIGTLVIAVIVYLMGGDPSRVLNTSQNAAPQSQTMPAAGDDSLRHFTAVVLGETEEVWNKLFQQMGSRYEEPKLVLFSGQTQSECGGADAATGPFYCPADQKVYLDLSFFRELNERFNVPGNFASAYVIAHEVGHHVQQLMGISGKVDQLRRRSSETEGNRLSVKLELQADFFAGVWAHYAKDLQLNDADIRSALTAANAIGDDRLQQESQGYVVPDAFTHGTSQQRMYWFKKGYETGDVNQGDTFNDPSLQ